jgi:hypothetical protein
MQETRHKIILSFSDNYNKPYYYTFVYLTKTEINKKDILERYSDYDINYTEETKFLFDLEIWKLQDNYWIKKN